MQKKASLRSRVMNHRVSGGMVPIRVYELETTGWRGTNASLIFLDPRLGDKSDLSF